jgi:hypothetical protein
MGVLGIKRLPNAKIQSSVSVKTEAIVFDYLTDNITQIQADKLIHEERGLGQVATSVTKVARLWLERGLIHAGRLEADIKKRLEQEETKKNGKV